MKRSIIRFASKFAALFGSFQMFFFGILMMIMYALTGIPFFAVVHMLISFGACFAFLWYMSILLYIVAYKSARPLCKHVIIPSMHTVINAVSAAVYYVWYVPTMYIKDLFQKSYEFCVEETNQLKLAY